MYVNIGLSLLKWFNTEIFLKFSVLIYNSYFPLYVQCIEYTLSI